MQLSVLFTALISFVVLATASPTPRAISIEELSSKREALDSKFVKRCLEEGADELGNCFNFYQEREELDSKFVDHQERELDNVVSNDKRCLEEGADELGNCFNFYQERELDNVVSNDKRCLEEGADELGNCFNFYQEREERAEDLGTGWDAFEERAEDLGTGWDAFEELAEK